MGDPICPIEFLQRLLQQVIEVDMEHVEIFEVLGMCNKTKSKFDCAICRSLLLKNVFRDLHHVLYPSMIGIEPPIGEMLSLEVLLRRELHGT